jgi:hypothetical protein
VKDMDIDESSIMVWVLVEVKNTEGEGKVWRGPILVEPCESIPITLHRTRISNTESMSCCNQLGRWIILQDILKQTQQL